MMLKRMFGIPKLALGFADTRNTVDGIATPQRLEEV